MRSVAPPGVTFVHAPSEPTRTSRRTQASRARTCAPDRRLFPAAHSSDRALFSCRRHRSASAPRLHGCSEPRTHPRPGRPTCESRKASADHGVVAGSPSAKWRIGAVGESSGRASPLARRDEPWLRRRAWLRRRGARSEHGSGLPPLGSPHRIRSRSVRDARGRPDMQSTKRASRRSRGRAAVEQQRNPRHRARR